MTQPRLLGGRYELDGVVGRGGMAEVYRARDIRLDRIVAIKTLRTDLARDQIFQARFRREAQSAASLNHPSIVAVYDTGEDMTAGVPVPYIVMEYVDGRTVRDLLIEGHRLLPERTLEIVNGVLRALEYSHQAGIVHRDIKPGNVMVTRNGDIKVMDFGIARAMSDAPAAMMTGPGTGMQNYPPRTGGFDPATHGGGGYPPQRKSWARRWLPWLIPAAVIIAVVAVVVSLMNSGGKSYFVPTVNNLPLAQA